MKTKLITLILFFITYSFLSQNKSSEKIENINYVVGTEKVKGYPILTKSYNVSNLNVCADKGAPILQVYELSKEKYIGGLMYGHKNKKTIIKDIKYTNKSDRTFEFKVIGKDFSESISSKDGIILKDDDCTIVFFTEKSGVWEIKRKNK